jgi:hypothetical protein
MLRLVIVVIALLAGVGFLLAFIIGGALFAAQKKARKTAYELLGQRSPDPKSVKKTIGVLATAKDTESQELVKKLMALGV